VDTVTYATLADIQGRGFESGSTFGNPLFKKTNGPFLDRDYRISAGSAAIGKGQNFSAYFTDDKDGNTRPASGAWDVGAY
ncbi:hypothetical protein M3M33_16720, partial [Loigolactobacillus coryniformis]|uniref:choice-of-anchor Q domain-containing protein n=1 Tax=Loigolactobacillus coryniformis TaxID=1610 RepID=UPI00201A3DA0